MRKKITKIIALATCIVTMSTTTIFGSVMKDVSTNHWAYNEIVEMQKRGLLVINSQGQFFPNNYVTYFELSEILAKATGYQDELVNPNMDAELKQSIRDNFAKQKPIIEAYQKNYKYWQKDMNEEIAYLLGKGYLQKEDLGKFMSKSTSGVESKRGVRKQEVTKYLVYILHKGETAKKEYVAGQTGFSDESSIDATLRSYVAYCKKIGIIQGNEKNQFAPNDPVTRATLSKMLVDTLKIRENTTTSTTPTPTTPPVTTDQGLQGKLTKMISKSDDEYYVVLEINPTKVHTYSISTTATVVDKNGNAVSVNNLKTKVDDSSKMGVNVSVQVAVKGTMEYVTHVQLIDETSEVITPSTSNKKVVGTIDRVGRNNDISIAITEGAATKLETYNIAEGAMIRRNNKTVNILDIQVGDSVDATITNEKITSLIVTGKEYTEDVLQGEVIKKSLFQDTYTLTIQNSATKAVTAYTVDKQATFQRNGENIEWQQIRIGDQVKLEIKAGVVTSVEAKGTERIITGNVYSLLIAPIPEITIDNNDGSRESYTVTPNAELYSSLTRQDISIWDIRLNQQVELKLDSKEVKSIVIKKAAPPVTITGIIVRTSTRGDRIEVRVPYDAATQSQNMIRTVDIPMTTQIVDGTIQRSRKDLQEDMQVVIVYGEGTSIEPEQVIILSK